MRALVVIMIAIGVILYGHSNAPTEFQMRDAFEHSLADQTAQTVEFIKETGGPSAVERVKAAGNDRFEVRAFQKLKCQQSSAKPGYDCTFNVDIDLANGMMHRTLEGRFYHTSTGIAFELVEQTARPSFAGR
jgi:FlaG/FlaF family flagellin (archaellin)